jgi:hypothetical protein
MGSSDQLLKGGRYVAYFTYVLVLLAIIYGTMQTILQAKEGSA